MLIQQIVNGVVIGSIYVLVALGLSLIFGVLQIPHFAHGALFMVGAFVGYILVANWHLNFFLSMFISIGILAVIGMFIEWFPYSRMRGAPLLNLMIAALGIYTILENGALLIWGEQPQVIPFPIEGIFAMGPNLLVSYHRLIIVFVSIIFISFTHIFMKRTRMGKATRAVANNPEASRLMGIKINEIYRSTMAVGTGLAALAGVLVGSLFFITPSMGGMPILKSFIIIIIGGMGSFIGAILGGYLLGILESISVGFFSVKYKDSFAFAILIIYLLVYPYLWQLWIKTRGGKNRAR
jgi:branched-chain amino acid transport system permease protein